MPDSLGVGWCDRCGEEHEWSRDEHPACIPPRHVLRFGEFHISREYRDWLLARAPDYTTAEVVGAYLGHGVFPSQDAWQCEQNGYDSDSSSEDSSEESLEPAVDLVVGAPAVIPR